MHVWFIVYSSFFFPFSLSPIFAQSPVTHTERLSLPVGGGTVLVEKKGDTTKQYILVGNHLGSTKVVLSDTGSIVSSPLYYPYGSTVSPVSLSPSQRLYTNQRKVTEESDLYNYNARYYTPDTGIFIQPDSVEGPTRFTYVKGNPVMGNDPTGHCIDGISTAACIAFIIAMGGSFGAGVAVGMTPPDAPLSEKLTNGCIGAACGVAITTAGLALPQLAAGAGAVGSSIQTGVAAASTLGAGAGLQIAAGGITSNPQAMNTVGFAADLALGDALPPGQSLVGGVGTVANEIEERVGGRIVIGVGDNTPKWRARGYRTLDINPNTGADYVADANNLEAVFPHDSLDEIYAEFIRFDPTAREGVHQARLLNQANATLKPGGRLRIETAYYQGLNPGETTLPDKRTFPSLMAQHGFEARVVEHEPLDYFWSWDHFRWIGSQQVTYEGVKVRSGFTPSLVH